MIYFCLIHFQSEFTWLVWSQIAMKLKEYVPISKKHILQIFATRKKYNHHYHSNLLKLKNFLTLIGMSYESKKNAHLLRHLGASFIRPNELGRVKLTLLMSMFTSKIFWKFLIKTQLTKSRYSEKSFFIVFLDFRF